MNGPTVLAAVFTVAALGVYAALEGSRLVREAFDELEARREWRRLCELSAKRRRLSEGPRVMRP